MKIKQFFHLVLACSLLLTAAACTEEVITKDGTDPTVPEGMQALTLKVGGISTGSVSKAGVIAKPEEVAVEDMTIYVFKYDPTLGDDDSDDNNYVLFDYWTYMKTPATGYTADSRSLHTFTLGGSGQFRTATVYVPKDAGKVKCVVTTGVGGALSRKNMKIYTLNDMGPGVDVGTLLSGIGVNTNNIYDFNTFSIENYTYIPFVGNKVWERYYAPVTLNDIKQDFWTELPLINASYISNTGTTINPKYWKTPLSMTGETGLLDIDGQSGNSSQLSTTLQRHVARLDIINNNLAITKIELINLPTMTLLMPAVDGMPTLPSNIATLIMGRNSTPAAAPGVTTPDEPANTYSSYEAYTGAAATPFSAITRYVYPNLPYNTTDNTDYMPFIRVTIEGEATPFILPFQTRNPDTKEVTPVNLKSNNRYTLQFNKLGDNMLDYNIVIAPWVAGEDFTANLGQDVTQTQLDYVPAITAGQPWDDTNNSTQMIGDKLYLYYQTSNPYGCSWKFQTANTLGNTPPNILVSSSPASMGTRINPDDISPDNTNPGYTTQTVTLPFVETNACPYGTSWYVLQNPYNANKYSRVKVEYRVPNATAFNDMFLMEETNAAQTSAVTPVAFKSSHYNTEWPDQGALLGPSDANNLLGYPSYTAPDFTKLCPPVDDTELDGVDLSAKINKTLVDADGNSHYMISSASQDAPCLIRLFSTDDINVTPSYLTMWERIKGANGYYIRMVTVLADKEDRWDDVKTKKSFTALRSLVYNVENGNQGGFNCLTRYLPEGDYWINASGKAVSIQYQTLGKTTDSGTARAYLRLQHMDPGNP